MGDRSVDARDISQSVVVTGHGNKVELIFGDTGIALPLRRRQFAPPDRRRQPREGEPPRELDLLVAEADKLPLIGRKDLFAELQAWLDDEADILVFALTGRAGTGKTRLAIEFCRLIDNDPTAQGGWIAGFFPPAEVSPVVKAFATRQLYLGAPNPSGHRLRRAMSSERWRAGSTGSPTKNLTPSSAFCCSTAKHRRISAGGTN